MIHNSDKTKNDLSAAKIIYYFSGTGNSYYVARTIADRTGAVLKPIVSIKKGDVIESDLLCFVFPVYDFKPPKKVTEILENVSKISANYTVAIGTYGVALSSTLDYFEKSLNQKGVILSRGYGIRLPHNAVGSIGFTDEENYTMISRADKKIGDIVGNIQARTIGDVERTSIFEDMAILKLIPCVMKFVFILIFRGSKSLGFTVTDDCIGCYQCKKICPVNNIEWANGKPEFGDDCTSCFACLQWCPEAAIRIGKYSFKEICMKHYHHPRVKAVDLFLDTPEDEGVEQVLAGA